MGKADIVNSGTYVDPFMPCSDVQTTPEYEQIRSQKVRKTFLSRPIAYFTGVQDDMRLGHLDIERG